MTCHARKAAGGVWTAWDSWCLGGLGIAVQLSPFSSGDPAAPRADRHTAIFRSRYLFSSPHHRLVNLELRTLFSSSTEALLQLSITRHRGIQWSDNKNNSEFAPAQSRAFTADSHFWLRSNQYHSFNVSLLVGHTDRIQIHYPSALDLWHLCGASWKSFVV